MKKRVSIAIGVVAALATAAAWWWSPWAGNIPSVQAAVQQACDTMQTTDYDMTITGSFFPGTGRIEVRRSGDDEHLLLTGSSLDGTPFAQGERILKDGVLYTRESTDANPTTFGDWAIALVDAGAAQHLPCFPPSSAQGGSTTRQAEPSSGEERYSHSYVLSAEEGILTEEFWVDSTGRPTRARRTITPPGTTTGESGAAGRDTARSASGGSTSQAVVLNMVYSGLGEPNVITAPTIP